MLSPEAVGRMFTVSVRSPLVSVNDWVPGIKSSFAGVRPLTPDTRIDAVGGDESTLTVTGSRGADVTAGAATGTGATGEGVGATATGSGATGRGVGATATGAGLPMRRVGTGAATIGVGATG